MSRPSKRASVGQGWSAGRRTAAGRPPPDRPPSMPGGGASASEGLTDRDVEAERRVALARIEREADIDARRTEVGVVAHTEAGTDARRQLGEIRQRIGIGGTRVDEGHDAERLADALAELDAAFDQA